MRFKITLRQNGIHSFKRGLETLQKYEKGKGTDKFLLKESIMFIHHGIELLLKEILVTKGNEHLIYSDISESTLKKVIQAKKSKVSVFDLPKSPKTATYLEVIMRVQALVDNVEITEKLETKLIELNTFRNNIEHYGIQSKLTTIENLLIGLKKPLTEFLTKYIPEIETELAENWKELDEEILKSISKLRNSGAIKKAQIKNQKAEIEYAKDYEEYKTIQPQSTVSRELYRSYWETGDAVLKALIDGSVRLLKEIKHLTGSRIILYSKDEVYEINVDINSLEKFTEKSIEEIRTNWNDNFSNKYVYSKQGRIEFFSKFGEIKTA
ncbi:hypothetical protein [Winogradskyella vidalii]|uniref:hypothetical protein n=1 Tax=Winogradskyella vidalii TaxID=2615024 RepID=UPI0015CA8106|nr:hypothetical protein [Winogradskyella vidalii]